MRVWALINTLAPWRSTLSRLGDAIVLIGALVVASVAWNWLGSGQGTDLPAGWWTDNATWFALWFALALLGLHLASTYASTRTTTWVSDLYGTASGLSIASVLTLTTGYFAGERSGSRLLFVLVWTFSVVGVVVWRWLARLALSHLRQHGVGQARILIIGGGAGAQRLIHSVERDLALGYVVAGYVADEPCLTDCAWLGRPSALDAIIADQRVGEIIIAGQSLDHPRIMALLSLCRQRGIALKLLPDTFELALTQVALEEVDGHPLVCLTEQRLSTTDRIKWAIDVLTAGLALAALAPLCLLIALMIRLDSAGPAIFRQTRVGRHGRLFTFYKFRSMHVGAEARLAELRQHNEVDGPIFKMRNDPRVTRVGRWLRRTSLDELPQLINVLKGDMSLVGPRPAVPDEVAKYADWQRARLEVIPGITGLWQVSGRSHLTFEEMVRLDLEYMERRSLLLDLMILLRTVPAVLSKRGAY